MSTQTKVMAFGEALIDFLSNGGDKDGQPETFSKFPGGAPANVAVAVARLGGNSHFAGQVGQDSFGAFLKASLESYGVNTHAMLMTDEAKTALAFVSLDESGERSFEFYRHPSADMLFRKEHFAADWFAEETGVFHTCSNTLTEESIADVTAYGVDLARRAGWIVSADVNLRHNLWPQCLVDKERVITWMHSADVIKASLEELEQLTDQPMELVRSLLNDGVTLFVLTDGGNPVRYYTASGSSGEVVAPTVSVKDTTAAGDAFVGGLLYQLAMNAKTANGLKDMSETSLHSAIAFAVACGACAVTKLGAYPSLPDLEQANQMLSAI